MKRLSFLLFVLLPLMAMGATKRIASPDGNLSARVEQTSDKTFLVMENRQGQELTRVQIGLSTNVEDFSGALSVAGQTKAKKLTTQYTNIHGKQRMVKKPCRQSTVTLQNAKGEQMDVELRLYNDGMAFRYLLAATPVPSVTGDLQSPTERTFTDELTAYTIPQGCHRWLQKYVTSYEGDFPYQAGDPKSPPTQTGAWGFPALFENPDGTFMLITEANATRMYCTSHLDNSADANQYKVSFPFAWEGREQGSVTPSWTGSWASPWRVVIAGGLKEIVESTLVDDVSDPTTITDLSWVKPGRAAWVYWAYNHGTKDFKTCCAYVDLAAEMGWEYVLFDWEWDAMTNGGKLEDAVAYALSKGVKPWIWYNSGGNHTWVRATPLDRMLTHENRVAEFTWLKKLGIVGVKVDFFESDKQNIVNYYLDILEDAEKFKMMVNFHGCTVPRGWSHTYPHLMSQEAVYGAEQYNNAPFMTDNGARINCLLPYTRNVVGPMDYTPVAFTNSQHPHRTTYTHELALSVAFESGLQHWADRPEGFRQLPDEAREHMKQVPVVWDETRFLSGYPGKSFVVARRSGSTWYVAGLNGTNETCDMTVDTGFLGKSLPSGGDGGGSMTSFTDGKEASDIAISHSQTEAGKPVNVSCLPMGGFLMVIKN